MKERLFSLDLLRGLDMFLLKAVGPLVMAADRVWHLPSGVTRQFDHAWGGFTLWDVIMPLFIFMCGAAVPLALPKRLENGRAGWGYWRHVLSRVALLWVLGMAVQGNLLSLKPSEMLLFSNTLQSIAVGYVVAALALLVRNARVRAALPFALVLVYSLILAFGGDYSQTGNAAYRFETALVSVLPWIGNATGGGYTWILTSFMFGAMTLFGLQATEILRADRDPWTKAARLGGYGAGLLALGWALVPVVPAIKHIYTASFTLQAVGWSMLAYAALYVLTDIWKFRRGLGVLILFGQCALFVYVSCSVVGIAYLKTAMTLTQGLRPHFAETMPFVDMFVYIVVMTVVTWYYRAARQAISRKGK